MEEKLESKIKEILVEPEKIYSIKITQNSLAV